MTAELRFQAFLDTSGDLSAAALLDWYDTLETVPIEFMLGDWAGGVFPTGHEGERQMALMRWAGKTFHHRDRVDPIISLAPDDSRVVNPILGAARLRMVEFRGRSTATMIYDKHPIFDHFCKISDDLAMGVMDRKGDDAPLFFYLRRRQEYARGSEHA